jgi:hypothetical protein
VNAVTGVGPTTGSAVGSLTVRFSEAVDPLTVTRERFILTRNGGPNLIDDRVTITAVSDSVFTVGGLEPLTADPGSYLFTATAAGVVDRAGNGGTGVRTKGWTRTG